MVGFERDERGALSCDGVPLEDLGAAFGTPLHVVSGALIAARVREVRAAFGDTARICYAVKANSNLHLLRLFSGLGVGFDIVSLGELLRLQAAKVPTSGCVFAGVAKQQHEVEAAHRADILLFNIESLREVELLAAVGRHLGRPVRVAVRLNPDVDASTHEYISTGRAENKFGLDLETASRAVDAIRAAGRDAVRLVGYHVHLGSQLRSSDPYAKALDIVESWVDADPEARGGSDLSSYDLGGGFGIPYGDGAPALDVADVAERVCPRLEARGWIPIIEPGRFLIAEAGAMLTRVVGRKDGLVKRFVMSDAGMNDLLRPALYQAHHPIEPVAASAGPSSKVDVVGPICESGDFLGKDIALPDAVDAGDLLAVRDAGAYGAVMSSNYNARPRAAEVLVENGQARVIRRRERYEDLWAHEVEPLEGSEDS